MYFIYTIGDAVFLQNILNGIAGIMGGAHEGEFTKAIQIALLIGVVLSIAKGLLGEIDVKGIFLGLFLYLILFVPKVAVVIEDVYTGDTYPVGNVPIGIAAVGEITSTIGFTVAQWFDQALIYPGATAGITDSSYLNALEIMTSTRKFLYNRANYGRANAFNSSDVYQSWVNYFQDCTLVGIDLGLLDPQDVYSGSDPFDAIRFESETYVTQYILTGATITASCNSAWLVLRDYTHTTFIPELVMDMRYNIMDSSVAQFSSSADVFDAIVGSLSDLGQSTVDVQNYIGANFLSPIFFQSVNEKYQNDMQYTSAVMLTQAIQQRNIQWAAEQSIFQQTFRPLYTFVEGVIYGIAPLMALLVAIGPIGTGLAMKYLLGLIWIQLWIPMLSVANLFIYLSASQKMANLPIVDMQMPSLGSITLLDDTLSTWLAVGAYMASSAPVLALFILSGSVAGLSRVAGNMSGSAQIDPKMVRPDTFDSKPALATTSPNSFAPSSGFTREGVDQIAPSLSYALGAGSQVDSARSYAQSAQQNLQSAIETASSSVLSGSNSRQFLNGLSFASGSTHSESREAFKAFANRLAKSHGSNVTFDDSKADQLRTALVGAMDAGASLDAAVADYFGVSQGKGISKGSPGSTPGVNVSEGLRGSRQKMGSEKAGGRAGGSVRGTLEGSYTDGTRTSVGNRQSKESGSIADLLDKVGYRSDFQNAVKKDLQDRNQQTWEARSGLQDVSKVSEAHSEAMRAENAYREAESFRSNVNSTQNTPFSKWSQGLIESGNAGQFVQMAQSHSGIAPLYANQLRKFSGKTGTETKDRVAAAYSAVSEYATNAINAGAGQKEAMGMFNQMASLISGSIPGGFGMANPPKTNDAVSWDANRKPLAGETGEKLGAAKQRLDNTELDPEQVKNNVTQPAGAVDNPWQQSYDRNSGLIEGHNQSGNEHAAGLASGNTKALVRSQMGDIAANMQYQSGQSPSWARDPLADVGSTMGTALNAIKAQPAALAEIYDRNVGNAEKRRAETVATLSETGVVGPIEDLTNRAGAVIDGMSSYARNIWNGDSPSEAFSGAINDAKNSYAGSSSQPGSVAKAMDAIVGATYAHTKEMLNTDGFEGMSQQKFDEYQAQGRQVIKEALAPMQEQFNLSDAKMEAIASGLQLGAFRSIANEGGFSESVMGTLNAFMPNSIQDKEMARKSDWYQENFENLRAENAPIFNDMNFSNQQERDQALDDFTHKEMDVLTNAFSAGDHMAAFILPVSNLQQAQDDYQGSNKF